MLQLMSLAKSILCEQKAAPFSVYSSIKEQHLFNVPITKPLLIFVLGGTKKLGRKNELTCASGDFIFLSNSPKINMRNIPGETEYFALLIEFEYEDFNCFDPNSLPSKEHIHGEIDELLLNTLEQFLEWTRYAPKALWPQRRQEILKLLYYQGYEEVSQILEPPSLTHRVQQIIAANISADIGMDALCIKLSMSESTIRRKLQKESSTFQELKDRVKLGAGLHLLQTTDLPIGSIAEQCGYLSQSRFTEKFKQLFGITPSALRKTRLLD